MSSAPTRILLVEGHRADAELIRTVIERAEFGPQVGPLRVTLAGSAAAAVEKLASETFQIVLTDLALPDARGLEALLQIQAAAKPTPIIVLSATGDIELSRLAIRSGAQDFLFKDHISGEILVRAIRHGIERHGMMAAALENALTDDLTGLHNRRGMASSAGPLAKSAARLGEPIVLLYFDLDGLKTINDTWGHAVGDAAICEFASALRASFRGGDVVARLGGDEFAVLAVGALDRDIAIMRRRIETNIETARESLDSEGSRPYRLSFSMGAVELDGARCFEWEKTLGEADRRMYGEKRAKRALLEPSRTVFDRIAESTAGTLIGGSL